MEPVCYIFGAAPISDYQFVQLAEGENRCIICADGGLRHAKACGVVPDWIVGDFDSGSLETAFPQVIRVRPEKDDTDMELAVSQGEKLGYRKFVIYGALGGRFDHGYANLQMIAGMKERGLEAVLVDEQNQISVLKDETVSLQRDERYPYLSLFSFSEESEGVTLTGMKYPLVDYLLKNTSAGLSVSNEILGESGTVSVRKGTLFIMRSRDLQR